MELLELSTHKGQFLLRDLPGAPTPFQRAHESSKNAYWLAICVMYLGEVLPFNRTAT